MQALLVLWFWTIGLLFLFAFQSKSRPAVKAALALPVGAAINVLTCLSLLILCLPLTKLAYALSTVAVGALFTTIAIKNSVHKGISTISALKYLGFATLIGALSAFFNQINWTIMSYDSFALVRLGRTLSFWGNLDSLSPQIASWGIFPIILHAIPALFDEEYFKVIHPMIGLSFLPIMYLYLYQILGERSQKSRVWLSLSLSFLFFSTYFVIFQLFYIHNSLLTSLYLFVTCSIATTYIQNGHSDDQISLASISIAALVLLRIEMPLVVSLMAACLLSSSRIGTRTKAALLGPALLLASVWNIYLLTLIGDGSDILTPRRVILLLVPTLAICGITIGLSSQLGQNARLALAASAPLVLGLALGYFISKESSHTIESLNSILMNIHSAGRWGYTWHVVVALTMISIVVVRKETNVRLFALALSYMLLVIVLGSFRTPYRLGWGDSANRMLTHILPLLLLVIASSFSSKTRPNEPAQLV